ncbi:MAG TPA: hypothetical protein EYP94_00040 [Gammaproteobacteria bacterium]|jgi:hypothetical protein|nr:hypothetical protein [Gammaproteobacteria bacterium]
MDQIKIWNNVSENIKFFTLKTSDMIPETSGIYAWFLPLWLFQKDINKTLDFVQAAMVYDSQESMRKTDFQGKSQRQKTVEFNWDAVNVNLKKTPKRRRSDFANWDKIKDDDEAYTIVSETLMKASIFSRPLYIGRTNNLKARYIQHTSKISEKNSFNMRFNEFVENYNSEYNDDSARINLSVHDLVFAVITVNNQENSLINDKNLTELLESALMNIAQPPFSSR